MEENNCNNCGHRKVCTISLAAEREGWDTEFAALLCKYYMEEKGE